MRLPASADALAHCRSTRWLATVTPRIETTRGIAGSNPRAGCMGRRRNHCADRRSLPMPGSLLKCFGPGADAEQDLGQCCSEPMGSVSAGHKPRTSSWAFCCRWRQYRNPPAAASAARAPPASSISAAVASKDLPHETVSRTTASGDGPRCPAVLGPHS